MVTSFETLKAAAFIERLLRGGVDLTLYGHIHTFFAFSNGGIPAYISGGGGGIPMAWDGLRRHYLAIDVSPGAPACTATLVRVDD